MIELKAIGGKGSQENVMSDDKSPPTHKINVTTLKNNEHFSPQPQSTDVQNIL